MHTFVVRDELTLTTTILDGSVSDRKLLREVRGPGRKSVEDGGEETETERDREKTSKNGVLGTARGGGGGLTGKYRTIVYEKGWST